MCDRLNVSHFSGDHWTFPLKAKNFTKPNSFICLPNIKPWGMVPGSGNALVSKTYVVAAPWILKLVGRQMIGKETNKTFMIHCDEGS